MTREEGLEHFKKFCKARLDIDEDSSQDWFSLSLGYFAALGFDNDECHSMATDVRYDFGYWMD